jgi:hypothetical protein
VAVAVVLLALVVAACSTFGDARSEEQDRAAQVYEAVVRWFILAASSDDKPVVFVEPRGEGSVIGLSVQSELIRAVDDVADVRFIDARDEALEEDDEGQLHVRDGGLLLRFGPVPETGTPVDVDVDRFVRSEGEDQEVVYESLRFTVEDEGESWGVVDEPESVTTT